MKALGRIIVPSIATTPFDPTLKQQGPFISAMLCVKNLIYLHCIIQNHNHIDVTMKYMEDYLNEFDCDKDIFHRFCAKRSTNKVSDAVLHISPSICNVSVSMILHGHLCPQRQIVIASTRTKFKSMQT
jgi:amino acid permease